MLATQMLWVIGNIPNCTPIEVFESTLTTTAPLMEALDPENPANEFADPVPKSIEEWIEAQETCPDFASMLEESYHKARHWAQTRGPIAHWALRRWLETRLQVPLPPTWLLQQQPAAPSPPSPPP